MRGQGELFIPGDDPLGPTDQQRRINDMKPFLVGILTHEDVDWLVSQREPKTITRTCPFCMPDVVTVKITRKKTGWRIGHPAPVCPEFARYYEAM